LRKYPVFLIGSFVYVFLASDLIMAKEADRLFRDNEVFEITIRAPFEKIKKQNKKSLKFAGTLSYLERDGRDQNLNIKVEVRGNNRLKKSVCKFPPLKIRFNKKSNKKTLFAKQKSLKLVTQCDPYKTQYAGYLMKEYLAYRIFNLIPIRVIEFVWLK